MFLTSLLSISWSCWTLFHERWKVTCKMKQTSIAYGVLVQVLSTVVNPSWNSLFVHSPFTVLSSRYRLKCVRTPYIPLCSWYEPVSGSCGPPATCMVGEKEADLFLALLSAKFWANGHEERLVVEIGGKGKTAAKERSTPARIFAKHLRSTASYHRSHFSYPHEPQPQEPFSHPWPEMHGRSPGEISV
jgi:hypothetical protein